jgi:hypothetical protein
MAYRVVLNGVDSNKCEMKESAESGNNHLIYLVGEDPVICMSGLTIEIFYYNITNPLAGTCVGTYSHTCNHAKFYVSGNTTCIGIANLNNAGGADDAGLVIQTGFGGTLPGSIPYQNTAYDRYWKQEISLTQAQVIAAGSPFIQIKLECACTTLWNGGPYYCHNPLDHGMQITRKLQDGSTKFTRFVCMSTYHDVKIDPCTGENVGI